MAAANGGRKGGGAVVADRSTGPEGGDKRVATGARPALVSAEVAPHLHEVISLLLAVGGYLVGWGVLTVANGHPARSRAFAEQPEFTVWRAIVGGEVALWMAILPYAVTWRREMHERCRLMTRWPQRIEWLAVALLILLIVVPLATTPSNIDSPLSYNGVRMLLLSSLGIGVAVIVVLGFTGTYTALRSSHWEASGYEPQHYLEDLRFLGAYKRRYLAVAGAMISTAVLATAVLQKTVTAHNASEGHPAPAAPPGLLLALGGLFVAVLACVYLPCHLYMRERGERLLDQCITLSIHDDDVAEKIQRRNVVRDELDLRRSARQNLTDAVVIFAPLLSGALALWISPG